MGKLLDKAIVFATKAHEGQLRKGTDIPYILHPLEAASIVATMTTDDEILAGAVLHDVVEDTNTTIEQICDLFGERVAEFVDFESEDKRKDLPASITWTIRKHENIRRLRNAPVDALMITLGDELSNVRAIKRDFDALGDEIWQRFSQKDKKEHYWYYKHLLLRLSQLEEHQAYKELFELLTDVFERNKQS